MRGFYRAGGNLGFIVTDRGSYIDNFTLKLDLDEDGTFETVAHKDDFTLDSSGYAHPINGDFESHDAAGNLIWDGVHKYTYDAWNRLARIEKAYREPNGTPSGGSLVAAYTVATMEYDGTHRRTVKRVQNSADLDCTYHFYYDASWRLLETRNGSEQVIQQHVWGQMYIDELVQVANNGDIIGDEEFDPLDPDHDPHYYWAQHDANFNVIGLVDGQGALVERYEYTPYGQRTVYFSPGPNDPTCHAATTISRRADSSGTTQPWGVNSIGHQGLWHDESLRTVYNRYRARHLQLGRFLQRDPMGFPDGMSAYTAYSVLHDGLDPSGLYEIDFHYYVIYYLLRAKCYNAREADAIAGWSQYVDDSPTTGPLRNGLNPELLERYHFHGAANNSPVIRNPDDLQVTVARRFTDYAEGGFGVCPRLGVTLHTYADTWAHETFTPWHNSSINLRTGSIRPNIGHADDAESGHATDRPYNDIPRALEAARAIYDLIPDACKNKCMKWSDIEEDLTRAFKVDEDRFDRDYKERIQQFIGHEFYYVERRIVPTEDERVKAMQHAISVRFGDSAAYDRDRFANLEAYYCAALAGDDE